MNGAIDTFSLESLQDRVLHSLIPKIAAPVVPPQKSAFDLHEYAFDASAADCELHVKDLLAGADLWGKTGLLISQTKLNRLAFRSSRYRRIAAAYLSWRTGMSYGFLARQRPVLIKPAFEWDEAPPVLKQLDWAEKDFNEIDHRTYVALRLNNKCFLVGIPEVSVLCTRSGCEKTRLDPTEDLVELALNEGRMSFGIPKGVGGQSDCQPSFDTVTIFAHAVGNALIATILEKLKPSSKFYRALSRKGLALAHWHGYLRASEVPPGYYFYGNTNPPVSCSTPQAAIYTLSGKLGAFERSLEEGVEYQGDVHEEPSHGTNMTGKSLVELAHLVSGTAMQPTA